MADQSIEKSLPHLDWEDFKGQVNEARGIEDRKKTSLAILLKVYGPELFTLEEVAEGMIRGNALRFVALFHKASKENAENKKRFLVDRLTQILKFAEKDVECFQYANYVAALFLELKVKPPGVLVTWQRDIHLGLADDAGWKRPARKQYHRGLTHSSSALRGCVFEAANILLKHIGIRPALLRHEIIGEYSKKAVLHGTVAGGRTKYRSSKCQIPWLL